jgi:hypothetical protein
MPLIAQRIVRGLTPFVDPYMTPAQRLRPERIILGVKPGHRPSDRPPVRIFLGSERKQFRAERTFIWSVEKHRDPSRIYEIHLLKGLKGYISGFWITGFTNYRFAIPYFCDYQGRAIYNDVDQVWLTDPAELFDRDMGPAGFLSINDHDSSVMLIDCKRMAGVWSRENVLRTTRKRIEARARAAGLWGPMEGKYNARDAEYVPGESACVHFTTLHTQPWRPFPDWFVYHHNPTGSLWFDLEDEANSERFLPVSALRPSAAWPDTALALSSRPDGPELGRLLGALEGGLERIPKRRISGLLERVPDADLPWVLNRLFQTADRLELELHEPVLIRRGAPRRPLHYWIEQLQLASRMNPETRWRLVRKVGLRRRVLTGGPLPDGPITVLRDIDPAARAEAEAAGTALADHGHRDLQFIDLAHSRLAAWMRSRFIRRLPTESAAAVLVAAGKDAIRAARRIAARSEQPPRLVLLGADAGTVPEHAGVVLSLDHHALPPHPNRIISLLGVGGPIDSTAKETTVQGPCALLLCARPGKRCWNRSELQRLLDAATEWASRRKPGLKILLAPSAGIATNVLRTLTGEQVEVHDWVAERDRAALDSAPAVLLAGEDLQAWRIALSSPRPVYLQPWLDPRSLRRGLAARVAARAFRPDYNKRGSIRPQQGLTYLCARLIERGRVVPPNGLEALQKAVTEAGLAAWIGAEATPSGRYRDETDAIITAVFERMDSRLPAEGDARMHRSR